MNKKYFILFLVMGFVLVINSACFAEKLMIADFNRGEKPNLISGDFGAWNKTEWDRSQFCNETFTADPDIVYGSKGCSLQLDYDVDPKEGGGLCWTDTDTKKAAYNGLWMRLEKIDLNKYDEFVFYVKGDADFGYTNKFKVEITSMAGDMARFYVTDVCDSWQKVVLPLYKIKNDGDFSQAYEFKIVFEDTVATKKEGRIYIDEIYVQ